MSLLAHPGDRWCARRAVMATRLAQAGSGRAYYEVRNAVLLALYHSHYMQPPLLIPLG